MNSIKSIGLFLVPFFLSLPALAQNISGVLMVVKGDIKVTSLDGKTEAAKVGKKVSAGDTISAGVDSRAKIVMSDKNVINVSPETKIKIEKYTNDGKDKKEVELNVVYGKVRASVEQKYDGEKSKFNIKTPSAVAGVRGTDFITGYNPITKVSQVITFSGTVAVGSPGPNGTIRNPVYVQPGQMTEAGSGKTPEAPKPVPQEELMKLNTDSKSETTAAKQEPQIKETSSEKKEEPKKEEPKKEGDKSATTPKQETRLPSSESPGALPPPTTTMFDPSMDLPSTDKPLLLTGPAPTTYFPPPIVTNPLPTQFIDAAIRNSQKAKTTIILSPQ